MFLTHIANDFSTWVSAYEKIDRQSSVELTLIKGQGDSGG